MLYQLLPVAVSYAVRETKTVDEDLFASMCRGLRLDTRERTVSAGMRSYGGALPSSSIPKHDRVD